MNRRHFLRAAAGAAGGLLLGGCSKRPTGASSSFRFDNSDLLEPANRISLHLGGADVGPLTPFGYFPPGYGPLTFVFDTLLWPDCTGRLLPWLASMHQVSPNGLLHTFELRDNVRWHDGKPFTADDVTFTYDYFKAQLNRPGGVPPWVTVRPQYIAAVKKVGERTVQFELELAAQTFAREVAGRIPIVPNHVWSSIPSASGFKDSSALVGTGPYRLKSAEGFGKGGYLFEANDDFFLGKPFVQRIEMRPVSDELVAFKTAEIDATLVQSQPGLAKTVQALTSDPANAVLRGPLDQFVSLHWNISKGGPLADPEFRQACALAIDRNDLVKRLLGGEGAPGNPGLLPTDHPDHTNVSQYSFDLAAANRKLDQAGYKRGAGGEIRQGPGGRALEFTVEGIEPLTSAAQLIINALKAVGIGLKFKIGIPISTDYEMAVRLAGGASGDPDLMRKAYSSNHPDPFIGTPGYVNKQMDSLADQQLVTVDETDRKKLLAKMQQIAATDLPMLPLYYSTPLLLYKPAIFDQWVFKRGGTNPVTNSPVNKQLLVTGLKTGGTKIRPVKA